MEKPLNIKDKTLRFIGCRDLDCISFLREVKLKRGRSYSLVRCKCMNYNNISSSDKRVGKVTLTVPKWCPRFNEACELVFKYQLKYKEKLYERREITRSEKSSIEGRETANKIIGGCSKVLP